MRKHTALTIPKEVLHLRDIQKFMKSVDPNDLNDFRTAAIISLGFFVFFRAAEMLSLTRGQIEFVDDHLLIKLLKSKTDQMRDDANIVLKKLKSDH